MTEQRFGDIELYLEFILAKGLTSYQGKPFGGKKDVPACGPDSYLKLSVPTGRLSEKPRMEDFVRV
jgi:hypothetical protein